MTTTLDDPDILHDTPTTSLTALAAEFAALAEAQTPPRQDLPTRTGGLVHEAAIWSELQEARARLARAAYLATRWEHASPALDVHPYAQQVRAHAYALRQALGAR
jgi:hypothetical protein